MHLFSNGQSVRYEHHKRGTDYNLHRIIGIYRISYQHIASFKKTKHYADLSLTLYGPNSFFRSFSGHNLR